MDGNLITFACYMFFSGGSCRMSTDLPWKMAQHFILCIYRVTQYLPQFLSREVFFQSHRSWDICVPFVTTYSLSPFMPISSLLLSFSDCISRVPGMAVLLIFPHPVVSSMMPFTFYSNFTSNITTLYFFTLSSLLPVSCFDNPS